jgi:hypothetical protein
VSDELATDDLFGVEILATGGPIHGRGSPPDGDRYSRADLEGMVAAARELEGEFNPPAKIGHGSDQPAVGWLENLRLNVEGTKLLADVRRVPRKLAQLIRAGAYRSRSVELSRVTSQRSGKRYPLVVSGLAWLGANLPAVRTLDDAIRLYDDDPSVELVRALSVPSSAHDSSVVGDAIERGALDAERRTTYERWYETNPELTAEFLAGLPSDEYQAQRNFQLEHPELVELEREQIAATFGIPIEEVL